MSWRQAGTTWSKHQSSWVWSIQFLPEGDLDASPLTTWYGSPSRVTGRQWRPLAQATARSPPAGPCCPRGIELPCLSRCQVTTQDIHPLKTDNFTGLWHVKDKRYDRSSKGGISKTSIFISKLLITGNVGKNFTQHRLWLNCTIWPWEDWWGTLPISLTEHLSSSPIWHSKSHDYKLFHVIILYSSSYHVTKY